MHRARRATRKKAEKARIKIRRRQLEEVKQSPNDPNHSYYWYRPCPDHSQLTMPCAVCMAPVGEDIKYEKARLAGLQTNLFAEIEPTADIRSGAPSCPTDDEHSEHTRVDVHTTQMTKSELGTPPALPTAPPLPDTTARTHGHATRLASVKEESCIVEGTTEGQAEVGAANDPTTDTTAERLPAREIP